MERRLAEPGRRDRLGARRARPDRASGCTSGSRAAQREDGSTEPVPVPVPEPVPVPSDPPGPVIVPEPEPVPHEPPGPVIVPEPGPPAAS